MYRVHLIYKPGLDLYSMDWLSQNNHTEIRDQEIAGMRVNVNAINTLVNIPMCISMEDIQAPTQEDVHLWELNLCIIQGWLKKKEELGQGIRLYWTIGNKLAMIYGIMMKGKGMIIPFQLQEILLQLYINYTGLEKMRFLEHESVYRLNMNADIENIVKHCATCLG